MTAIYTSPNCGPVHSSSLVSRVKSSRRRFSQGTNVEVWANWRCNSIPSSAGTIESGPPSPASFTNRGPSEVLTDLFAMPWITNGDPYATFGTMSVWDAHETPSFPITGYPYASEIFYLPTLPNDWALDSRSWATTLSGVLWGSTEHWAGYGEVIPWGMCQMWHYLPLLRGVGYFDTPLSISFQNPILAQRGRYRINGTMPCIEASCELWVACRDYSGGVYGTEYIGWPSAVNNNGVPPGMGMQDFYPGTSQHRLTAKNFKFIRNYTVQPFPYPDSSQDVTAAFNYPGAKDVFNVPEPEDDPTAADGFLGMMVFHALETRAEWIARTGITI
jgi:hypothetical protein